MFAGIRAATAAEASKLCSDSDECGLNEPAWAAPPRVSAQTPALILSAGKSLTLSVVDSRHWRQQKEATFLSLIKELFPVLCSVFLGSLIIDQQLSACKLFQNRLPHFLVSSKISGQIEDLAISSRWQKSFNLSASVSQDDPEWKGGLDPLCACHPSYKVERHLRSSRMEYVCWSFGRIFASTLFRKLTLWIFSFFLQGC